MNAEQKRKIIEVISNDAEIQCRYENAEGQTCAIGGLAKAANIARPGSDSYNNGSSISHPELAGMLAALMAHYGLGEYELRRIQTYNDFATDQAVRRMDILSYIEFLPVSD